MIAVVSSLAGPARGQPSAPWQDLVKPGRIRLDYQLGKGAEACDSEVIFRKILASELGGQDPFVLTGPADLVVVVRIEADWPGYRAIVEVRDKVGGLLGRTEKIERTCTSAGDRAILQLMLDVFPWGAQPTPPTQAAVPAPPQVVTKEEFDAYRKATDEAIDELRERNRALDAALKETRKRVDITYAISAGALMTANLTSNVGPGAWLGAEGRFGPVSMGLELRGVFPSQVAVIQEPLHDFDYSSVTASLVPCGRYSYFFGCAILGTGVELHTDSNFDGKGGPFTHTLAIFQFGGRLGLEVPFGDSPFAGRLFGEATFTLPPTGEGYQPEFGAEFVEWERPSVAAFFGAGLVFKFGNEGAK